MGYFRSVLALVLAPCPARRFCSDRSGATAIEYGLIAFLLSVAIVASVTQVGASVTRLFNTVLAGVTRLN